MATSLGYSTSHEFPCQPNIVVSCEISRSVLKLGWALTNIKKKNLPLLVANARGYFKQCRRQKILYIDPSLFSGLAQTILPLPLFQLNFEPFYLAFISEWESFLLPVFTIFSRKKVSIMLATKVRLNMVRGKESPLVPIILFFFHWWYKLLCHKCYWCMYVYLYK